MSKLKTLNDGLLEGLKDLYNAEKQIIKILPKIEKKVKNANLKAVLAKHVKETESHLLRLDKLGLLMQSKLTGKICKAMQGIVEEANESIQIETKNAALKDVMLVAAVTRIEYYEVAAYRSVLIMAKELGNQQIVKILEETYEEETKAIEKLYDLSIKELVTSANIVEEDLPKSKAKSSVK